MRHSRLIDEFDKFAAKERESLESVYERLTTLVNIMDRNNVCLIPVSINTKFLNCLQPERSKYVTMVRHNQKGDVVSYDELYDSLVQFEPHVQASKAKKASKNHDPLALLTNSNASSSQSHANSSYSPQPYYVTHPSSVDGRVDIQTKNAGYGGNGNRNAGSQNRNQAFNAGNRNDESNQIVQRALRTESTSRKANVQCYNCNEKGHYARDCQKPRVCDAKYFREQMLLAIKDEAESNLKDEENDFMLDNSYGDEILEEITAAAVSEVNVSNKVHKKVNHVKHKTIIHTSYDDQIDYNIIFDDPYVENNGGTSKHDSNAHDEYHDIQMLAYNVQKEAESKKRLNNELKRQKELLQKELETFKDWVKTFESKTIQCSKYKETCEELEHEICADKGAIERILKEKDKIKTKKAFKERENRYLEDICDLEEKLSSHDLIVYKMGQSIQTIHMLGKQPNKVYDLFLKAGLGSKNPERLKKAIAAQLKIDETLEDVEESRLKMRNKMVQLNYGKLNALYETFVPQQ
ncbi:putative ribonuclease H-like domain-containing protein [Tanacetum coccineum]|uniref:Ribonuclease H-like domain-containing protein n=1 Tax=Tanacetum coccineum TaxID=301880 RepID=A0ABQ5EG14_9ASTR